MNDNARTTDLKGNWLPYLILAGGLALTIIITYYASQTVQLKARRDFEAQSLQIQNEIRTRMEAYIALLRGGSGLFAVNDWVTDTEFRAYVARLHVSRFYPGVQGIGLAYRVTLATKPTLLKRLQEQKISDFKIHPDENLAETFPIIYLEPLDQRNRAAIGYDMFSDPTRRAAMERARDQGGPAASGRVTLVQEISGPEQPGFLIFVPVYSTPDIPNTLESRRQTIESFIYSPFRAHDLLDSALAEHKSELLDFQIHLGAVPNEANLIYSSTKSGFKDKEQAERVGQLEIAGQTWSLRFFPRDPITGLSGLVFSIPLAGISFTCVVFYLLRVDSIVRRDLERTARELRASEERFRLMVEGAVDYAIVTLDSVGHVASWNPGAKRILGYDAREVVGQSREKFFTPESVQRGEPEAELRVALEKGSAFHERWHVRKDGSLFWASDYIIPLRNQAGHLRGFAKIIRDITERKKAIEEIEKLNSDLENRVLERTAALRESYEQMETLTYTVAHDLRAPLRAMQGFALMLAEDYTARLDDNGREYLQRIMNASKRMDALIQDLLSYSQLARSDLKFEAIHLRAVVESALHTCEEEIRRRNAIISVE